MLGALLSLFLVITPLAEPDRFVTDHAEVLHEERVEVLNARLAHFERETTNQVVVYIDRKLPRGVTMEELATASFNEWGVGQEEKNNGVVLFLFIDDRKWRIETGEGARVRLTDAQAQRIGNEILVPRLRSGDASAGIEAAAEEMMKVLRDPPPAPAAAVPDPPRRKIGPIEALAQILFVGSIAALVMLWRIRRRRRRRLLYGYDDSDSFSGGGGSSRGGGASGSW